MADLALALEDKLGISPRAVPDLAVVVVTWNSRHHIDGCLDAVAVAARHGHLDVDVVVVDNDSSDGTTAHVGGRHPAVRVVPMGVNAGYARAVNRGLIATSARHRLVLNPDTVVDAAALGVLVRFADLHGSAGVVAPALVFPDGSDQRTARRFPAPAAALFGRRSPLTRWFPANRWSTRFHQPRIPDDRRPYRVDWVSGAAMVVPERVLATVGGMDEGYFLYWEDADWCRRIHDAGLEVWVVPEARVVHDEGGTRHHRWPARVVVHFHRGAYRYWRLHHAPGCLDPRRWGAAIALTGRALAVMVGDRVGPPHLEGVRR